MEKVHGDINKTLEQRQILDEELTEKILSGVSEYKENEWKEA